MLNGSVAMPLMVTPLTCMADDDPARGYIIGATLFVSGITTLLQATFGTRSAQRSPRSAQRSLRSAQRSPQLGGSDQIRKHCLCESQGKVNFGITSEQLAYGTESDQVRSGHLI